MKILKLSLEMILLTILIVSGISVYKILKLDQNLSLEKDYKATLDTPIEPTSSLKEQAQPAYRPGLIATLQSTVNKDVSAWLKVDNTNIDYPVVYSSDNEFYLTHNTHKNKDINGAIFMDMDNTIEDDNIIFYGHTMKAKNMFTTLRNFREETFFLGDNNIHVEYESSVRTYEPVAVITLDLTNEEDVFFFINHRMWNTQMNAVDYVNNFGEGILWKKERIYPDDKLLTLCTCTYETADARLLVIGKEINRTQLPPINLSGQAK